MSPRTAGNGTLRAFATSATTTARLLRRRQLAHPRRHLGRWLRFADGTRSVVYRETVRVGATIEAPTLLVVRFRLRVAGRSQLLHAAFRVESMLHTPLFVGFPGFRSKLWLTDLETGVYRGVYDWDRPDLAAGYAETLSRLLRVVCQPGTVSYHVEAGVSRDEFLRHPDRVRRPGGTGDWWALRDEVAM